MRIKQEYKVRNIAGENVVIMQGHHGADLTRIISLNDSAILLWEALSGKDFSVEDAAEVLVQNYEVEAATAAVDAQKWIDKLAECQLLE